MELPNKCKLIDNFMGENLYNTLNEEIQFEDVYRMEAICSSKMSNQCDFLPGGGYPIYRHPVDKEPNVYTWTPCVSKIRDKINTLYPDLKLNHCLIRKYENGDSFLREHSDKTIDIKDDTYIFNYSSGIDRILILKNKKTRTNSKILLKDDSLFIMDLKTNDEYFHSIKKQHVIIDPRISLTFRTIDSFKIDGKIVGKGEEFQEFISDEIIELYKQTNKRDN